MGWDIGANGAIEGVAAMEKVARVCAWWTLAAGLLIALLDICATTIAGSLCGAALFQAVLHGLLGVSYLLAGTVSLGLAILGIAILISRVVAG
jgi:hypothetical protein